MKMRIALPMALAALPLLLLMRRGADAEPDAVSAASLTVSVSNITATTASIDYSRDKYDYGTRTLCYDPAPASPTHNCTTRNASGNQGTFSVTGLTPSTQYNFSIKAVDTKGGERPYTSSGTFKTLAATALAPALPGAEAIGGAARFDANGRRLDGPRAAAGRGVIFTNRMAQPAYR
jgi:hypothetical protein